MDCALAAPWLVRRVAAIAKDGDDNVVDTHQA
jgi:hypothetical protein